MTFAEIFFGPSETEEEKARHNVLEGARKGKREAGRELRETLEKCQGASTQMAECFVKAVKDAEGLDESSDEIEAPAPKAEDDDAS